MYVLPENETMNRWWYAWLIHSRFPGWLAAALGEDHGEVYLVQDHERALWMEEPRQSMRAVCICLLENYPKCSQDLNPIENMWRELRERLASTMPNGRETRPAFVQRLRNAGSWLNANRAPHMQKLCGSQKERARAVLNASPPGSRTEF